MKKQDEVIVVFDSGAGGLTVLSELKKFGFKNKIVYLADTKNAPYGDKTKEEVIIFVLENLKKLKHLYSFKAIVIACNTASVYAESIIKQLYNVPVFSVTKSAINKINEYQIKSTIDVLATNLTTKSETYKKGISEAYVRGISCPELVPLVESTDYFNKNKRKHIVHETLIGRAVEKVPYVILGCTHYPLLSKEIQEFYGDETFIFNPSSILAEELVASIKSSSDYLDIMYFTTNQNDLLSTYINLLIDENKTTYNIEDVLTSKTKTKNINLLKKAE